MPRATVRKPHRQPGGETAATSHARLRKYAWQHPASLLRLAEKAGVVLDAFAEGQGTVAYDEYKTTIKAMPRGVAPEDLLNELLSDLNGTVRNKAFDDVNTFKRRGDGGAPRVGDIYVIDIKGPDNGAVMLVDKKPNYFVFHTVTAGREMGRRHPERGVREFGFATADDGSVTFYTRGVSRPESLLARLIGGRFQKRGWLALVNGVGAEMERRGGSWDRGSTGSNKWEE